MKQVDIELSVYKADVFVMRFLADRRYFLVLHDAGWFAEKTSFAVQDDFGNLVKVER